MNNIFLDCGTHLCQGLLEFYDEKIINSSYKIYTFEANPTTYGHAFHRTKQIPLDITIYNAAVWVENGFVLFSQEMQDDNNPIGQGSSIVGTGFEHKNLLPPQPILSIDLGKFIEMLPEDSNIICKMDIEGAEFDVLRHLINEGTINRINKIYIEFHERFMENESEETKLELIKMIENLGVEAYEWK
jgi:FkbM family methyltransferase